MPYAPTRQMQMFIGALKFNSVVFTDISSFIGEYLNLKNISYLCRKGMIYAYFDYNTI